MNRIARTTIAGGAAALAAAAFGPGSAEAGAGDRAEGTVTSPGVEITFDARTDAAGNPSGTFEGRIKIGATLMRAVGPVTCLDVVGNRVGFFYPMAQTSPSLLGRTRIFGVYMNMTTDGRGNARSLSYSVVPKQRGGCRPAPTFIPASGKVDLAG